MESDGSLAALTAEVRQLRLTIEELIRSQADTQALSVRLSAHQSRIEQISGRLDAARSEVDVLRSQSQDYESRLASLSAELAGATDQVMRGRMEDLIRNTRDEQALIASLLQQARNRQSELSRALQAEEAQWNDLVAEIDRMTR